MPEPDKVRAWPKEIYVCPKCGRTEGPEFGMVPEGEPIFCNRHAARETVITHPADGYPRMVRIPVFPASVATEMAERLAREFEEIEALLDENRQAAAEQIAHKSGRRLRERAAELRGGGDG